MIAVAVLVILSVHYRDYHYCHCLYDGASLWNLTVSSLVAFCCHQCAVCRGSVHFSLGGLALGWLALVIFIIVLSDYIRATVEMCAALKLFAAVLVAKGQLSV